MTENDRNDIVNGELIPLKESSTSPPLPISKSRSLSPSAAPQEPPPSTPIKATSEEEASEEEDRESSPAESKTNWKRRCRDVLTLISFSIAMVITNAAYSLIGPFFPEEAKSKGATPITIGVIIAAAPFWVAVLSPVVGAVLHVIGARFVVFLGLLLIGTAYTLLAFVIFIPATWLFLTAAFLLRTVEGVGTAMFITAIFSQMPALFPKSVGTVVGVLNMAAGIGFSLGYPIGGGLFQLGGFQLPFIFVGLPMLVMIIPCVLLLRKTNIKRQALSVKNTCRIISDPIFIVLFLNMILCISGISLLQPTLQPYLAAKFNLNPAFVGLTIFIAAVTFLLSAIPVGLISDKVGHYRVFAVTGVSLIILAYVLISVPYFTKIPRYWYFVVGFILIGFGGALGMITVYPDMINVARKSTRNEVHQDFFAPLVSGMTSAGMNFGVFLGSVLGGVITQFLSFPLMALIFAELMSAQIIMLLAMSLINYCI